MKAEAGNTVAAGRFKRGAAANTEFEDRNNGENRHHNRDGMAGSWKSQPRGDLSKHKLILVMIDTYGRRSAPASPTT